MKNYKLIEWSNKLNLESFYKSAKEKNYINNSSQKNLIDCFKNEKRFNVWILYDHFEPVGSVAAHSFDDVMGEGSYRVLARCCVINGNRPNHGLGTAKRLISEHQNVNDQFYLPKCIEWANSDKLYVTSNQNSEGSQKLVDKIYFPTLQKKGIVEKIKHIRYRNTDQVVWKINIKEFQNNLRRFKRWQ
tara:strand:+ start:45625 stop:46188 length:564 start_codon:yes stop_codon:yes gene_type:complete